MISFFAIALAFAAGLALGSRFSPPRIIGPVVRREAEQILGGPVTFSVYVTRDGAVSEWRKSDVR